MRLRNILLYFSFCVIFSLIESRPLETQIRSDVIVTKWPAPQSENQQVDDKGPGWMRRQLMRFGEVTSRIGNTMGAHATKITSAIDKICDVIKTIIPFIAAVCHVGQYQFCASANATPESLGQALSPTSLNLNELDK